MQGDVSKPADVTRLFAEAKKAYGALDVLVNNAGVFKFAPLEEVTTDEYRREFDINVLGTILTTQEALKHFNGDGGSVINISSVVSERPAAELVGLLGDQGRGGHHHRRRWRASWRRRKIRVNVIAPGGVETEGDARDRHDRQRLREADRGRHAARPHRPAGRRRARSRCSSRPRTRPG